MNSIETINYPRTRFSAEANFYVGPSEEKAAWVHYDASYLGEQKPNEREQHEDAEKVGARDKANQSDDEADDKEEH